MAYSDICAHLMCSGQYALNVSTGTVTAGLHCKSVSCLPLHLWSVWYSFLKN